jgi:hypothetical protein
MSLTSSHSALQNWVLEIALWAGVERPAEPDPLGLEIEIEGRLARVLPHADEERAVIEIEVRSLSGADESDTAQLALQLLRLNHEARFEHGWSAVLDDEDVLCLSTTIELRHTEPDALANLLSDGIARAEALATISGDIMRGAEASQSPASVPCPIAFSGIRG